MRENGQNENAFLKPKPKSINDFFLSINLFAFLLIVAEKIFTFSTHFLLFSLFLADMELKPYLDNDFYIKESRDMITVVQSMIIAGNYQLLLLSFEPEPSSRRFVLDVIVL